MVKYELKEKKYYKDGKHITKKQVLKELKSYQLKKLLTAGKCGVREPKNEPELLSKRDLTLIESVRHKYRTEMTTYTKLGLKCELWRKNPKGYSNFVCYLDNLEQTTIDLAILKDAKEQRGSCKRK